MPHNGDGNEDDKDEIHVFHASRKMAERGGFEPPIRLLTV